jgi:helicase
MSGDASAAQLRAQAFADVKPSPQQKGSWLRDAARSWKHRQRKAAAERHSKRAAKCARADLISTYYSNVGTEFEAAFEAVLSHLGLRYERLDCKPKRGAPDYLVFFDDSAPVVLELKSRENDNLVGHNQAVEVLGASEIHGHRDKSCVTLCHPGVDPSVPSTILECGRLTVVESPDLGEALLRLCERNLSPAQIHEWLTTPGQAVASDLPFKE